MRRVLILLALLLLGILSLLVMGCGGPDRCVFGCEELTVESYEKGESCGEYVYVGEESLKGCHVANNVIDCYFFPFLCGYYENELPTGSVSCVRGGFDFTLLECYGDERSNDQRLEALSNIDTRTVVMAEEGVHYTVDKLSARLDGGDLSGFEDGGVSLGDLKDLVAMIAMMGEEAELELTLEYTALTELHSARFYGDIEYKGAYVPTNFTEWFDAKDGNGATYQGSVGSAYGDSMRSYNIAPGKHVINVVISFDLYECMALEDITNLVFSALTYREE